MTSKPYHDPELPVKPAKDEWFSQQNPNGHWELRHNGRVVKTSRTEEDLSDWWRSQRKIGLSKESRDQALGRAIERL